MSSYLEKILVVEDDPQIRNYIGFALEQAGFLYFSASNAQEGLKLLITEQIDIVVLDLGLPDFDGMDVIKKIREWSEVPIIVVSARDQDSEKAAALDLGADDYLTKPFSATELLARIRVSVRHIYKAGHKPQQNILSIDGLKIELDKHQVYLQGDKIHLTPMEYNLLSILFKNMGKVLTTGAILKQIWGVGYGTDTQALRALMAGLRRKIEENPAMPRYIITEIGVGYRLVDE